MASMIIAGYFLVGILFVLGNMLCHRDSVTGKVDREITGGGVIQSMLLLFWPVILLDMFLMGIEKLGSRIIEGLYTLVESLPVIRIRNRNRGEEGSGE